MPTSEFLHELNTIKAMSHHTFWLQYELRLRLPGHKLLEPVRIIQPSLVSRMPKMRVVLTGTVIRTLAVSPEFVAMDLHPDVARRLVSLAGYVDVPKSEDDSFICGFQLFSNVIVTT